MPTIVQQNSNYGGYIDEMQAEIQSLRSQLEISEKRAAYAIKAPSQRIIDSITWLIGFTSTRADVPYYWKEVEAWVNEKKDSKSVYDELERLNKALNQAIIERDEWKRQFEIGVMQRINAEVERDEAHRLIVSYAKFPNIEGHTALVEYGNNLATEKDKAVDV